MEVGKVKQFYTFVIQVDKIYHLFIEKLNLLLVVLIFKDELIGLFFVLINKRLE